MQKRARDYSELIQTTLYQTVGRGKAMTLKEASQISGVSESRLYQIANGNQRVGHNGTIPIFLLAIPPFMQRFGAAFGYDIERVDPEAGCSYATLTALGHANGEAANFWHDGKLDPQEDHKLNRRILAGLKTMIANCMARYELGRLRHDSKVAE